MSDVLPYERIDENLIAKAIRCVNGEFVVCRHPFRWKKDGQVISNAYESFSLESICEDNGWQIVETYGPHIAICKKN